MKNKILILMAMLGFLFCLGTARVYALTINPSTLYVLATDENSDSVIQTLIDPYLAGSDLLYKQEVGLPEEGTLASSYKTTFSNTTSDPSNALIEYEGGAIVDPIAYLLVKDGNQKEYPDWYSFYFYNLTALGWNGMETISIENFWTSQGAISHVSLYGTSTPVPEPATMLLLGSGLVGLATFGRRKFKKN